MSGVIIAGETDTDGADTAESFRGEKMSGSTGDVLPTLPDKPTVRLKDEDFKANCERFEEILSPYIYLQGGNLTRIGTAYEERENDTLTEDGRTIGPDGIRRNPAQPHLIPVTREWIERELSGLANIEKVMADGKVKRVSCPERYANNILRHGSPKFRHLAGIASAPFLRADGSICEEPGYDARSQTVYAPNADFPELKSEVTKDEAADAMGVLVDLISDFPFATKLPVRVHLAHSHRGGETGA